MLDDSDHQTRSGPKKRRDLQQDSAVNGAVLGRPHAEERPPTPVHIRKPVHELDERFHMSVAEQCYQDKVCAQGPARLIYISASVCTGLLEPVEAFAGVDGYGEALGDAVIRVS